MTADDLERPLGQRTPSKHRLAVGRYWRHALAGVLALALVGFGLWTLLASNPLGGEPIVRATIEPAAPAAKPREPAATPDKGPKPDTAEQPAQPAPGTRTVTVIDGSSGRRQDVVVRDPQGPGGAGPDPRLVETSRHGPIPKIAEDGTRAADVYARPSTAAGKKGPRIAIVIGGLGVSALRTTDAIDRVPAGVTLAFMPYAKDIEKWTERAIKSGHELVLQAPMEPFDYPDNDPGPQTLLTSLAAEQNVDRLQWFMSRFQGYVGVMNHAGGRFMATEQAASPVLREVARRGLIYLDDGGSPRSVASQIAGANNLAFAKADVVVDAAPTAAAIEQSLARLEAIARERGSAIGVSGAFPLAIERIAQWAAQAEERGLLLVPLSAVASKPKSS